MTRASPSILLLASLEDSDRGVRVGRGRGEGGDYPFFPSMSGTDRAGNRRQISLEKIAGEEEKKNEGEKRNEK